MLFVFFHGSSLAKTVEGLLSCFTLVNFGLLSFVFGG